MRYVQVFHCWVYSEIDHIVSSRDHRTPSAYDTPRQDYVKKITHCNSYRWLCFSSMWWATAGYIVWLEVFLWIGRNAKLQPTFLLRIQHPIIKIHNQQWRAREHAVGAVVAALAWQTRVPRFEPGCLTRGQKRNYTLGEWSEGLVQDK